MGVLFCRGFLCRRVDSCEGGHDMNRTYGLCFLVVFEIHISHFDQFMFSKSWHRGHIFFVPRYCKTQSACVLGLSLVYLKPLRFVFPWCIGQICSRTWVHCWHFWMVDLLNFIQITDVAICKMLCMILCIKVISDQKFGFGGTGEHGAGTIYEPSWCA